LIIFFTKVLNILKRKDLNGMLAAQRNKHLQEFLHPHLVEYIKKNYKTRTDVQVVASPYAPSPHSSQSAASISIDNAYVDSSCISVVPVSYDIAQVVDALSPSNSDVQKNISEQVSSQLAVATNVETTNGSIADNKKNDDTVVFLPTNRGGNLPLPAPAVKSSLPPAAASPTAKVSSSKPPTSATAANVTATAATATAAAVAVAVVSAISTNSSVMSPGSLVWVYREQLWLPASVLHMEKIITPPISAATAAKLKVCMSIVSP
jgi:hypothetical protein